MTGTGTTGLQPQSDTDQPGALEVAVATILQEHHTLGIVISALQQWLARVERGHAEPDFGFFSAAVYYINDFPERFHHPKEEEHLFEVVRSRTDRFDAAIDALQAEHVRSARMITRLERALVHYQGGAPNGLAQFKAAVDTYAELLSDHMRKEEALLEQIPAFLSDEDWRRIAAAFEVNDDPLYGSRAGQEFAQLYLRVVNMLPSKMRERTKSGPGPGKP